jgi:acid phosphatase type 7
LPELTRRARLVSVIAGLFIAGTAAASGDPSASTAGVLGVPMRATAVGGGRPVTSVLAREVVGRAAGEERSGRTADRSPASEAPATATVIVAGDIAGCAWRHDSATARLVDAIPGIVMTAGDNAYQTGTYRQFRDCYHPTWGRFRDRTRPTPGNHDWATAGAAGYFRYFGRLAGPPGRGYYKFDAGEWRVYALAGDCRAVGGCRDGSPQYRWLQRELAAHPRRCVLAVWHQPRFSSGVHGSSSATKPLLRLLFRAGAEVVVNGHDHLYERFAPARPDGTVDRVHGIRQFIVGTGGAPLYHFREPFAPNSRVRNASTHGVLRLTLKADRYAWEFIPVPGKTFTDDGSGRCHGRPPA